MDIFAFAPEETKINLEKITKKHKIPNTDTFILYLKEVWNDLSQRSFQNNKGINKLTFISYYPLPGIIADRLFSVLDKNKNGHIELSDFLTGMQLLFSSDFDENSKFIFDFYDFDKDGQIDSEDVRAVLSYISLSSSNSENKSSKYRERVTSQEELYEILRKCFDSESKTIDYKKFKNIIENINSDIYLIILLFLYENKPFTKANLASYESKLQLKFPLTSPKKKNSQIKLVASPNKHYSFSPYDLFKLSRKKRKGTFTEEKSTLNKELNSNNEEISRKGTKKRSTYEDNTCEGIISLKPLGDLDDQIDNALLDRKKKFKINRKIITSKNNETKSDNKYNDVKILPAFKQNDGFHSCIHYTLSEKTDSETTSTKSNNNNQDKFLSSHPSSNSVIKEELDENIENDDGDMELYFDSDEEDENKNIITQEGFLYKLVEGKMKRLWFKLIHKDLYFFKSENDKTHKGMHNLSGLFLKEEPTLIISDKKFYSFSVVYPSKTRYYYVENENDFNIWFEKLKIATGYTNLTDIYEVKEKIGNGKFGLVKLGIHKQTGKKVAIKIISKKEMKNEDLELVRSEIEILKICQHPNIIALYDVFENIDYFYIIMEYCSGGDLYSYLEKRRFKLNEKRVCDIVHKMCAAVYYIHSYGIAHRDLKPENVLMTDDTDEADIRILDFGLSKIISPDEKCTELYGTLSYVAPEILLEIPYTKAVDLWSLGVITYLMLTGTLPFDDPVSEDEIVNKVVLGNPSYKLPLWKGISKEAKSFVMGLLEKNLSKRMNIKSALEHEWITKFCGKDMTDVRRMSKEMQGSVFEFYSSTTSSLTKMF